MQRQERERHVFGDGVHRTSQAELTPAQLVLHAMTQRFRCVLSAFVSVTFEETNVKKRKFGSAIMQYAFALAVNVQLRVFLAHSIPLLPHVEATNV